MKGKSLTFRPDPDLRARMERLAEAREWTLTQIVEKAIVAHLPVLETKYAKELAEFDARDRAAKKAKAA